ncbi:hypothetical protein BLOT_013484 [Blomia tropicalis]|nr:hypothetical protein BLOT_013484 [Blomia tropicalis]
MNEKEEKNTILLTVATQYNCVYSTPIGLVGLPSKRKVQLRQSAIEKADDDGDDVDDDDDDDDGLWQQGLSSAHYVSDLATNSKAIT